MQLYELIKTRRNSQAARASVLYTLKSELYQLGEEGQVRVVRELIKDLQSSLREYKRVSSNKVQAIKQTRTAVVKASPEVIKQITEVKQK